MQKGLSLTIAAALVATAFSTVSAQDWGGRDGGGDRGDLNCDSDGDSNRRNSLNVIGLTNDQRLICFNEFRPGEARDIGFISGFSGDARLIGIDVRVQDNKLYGVGNAGGIYTLDTRSATALKVGQLTIGLQGNSFGVDFNPAANALRIVSDTGQNLRVPFATGSAGATVMDGTLTYPPATTPATGIAGAGYTNNDLDASTATTLYDVDSMMDQIAIQSPANAGSLAPTGKLTVDTNAQVGFDVYSVIRNNVTVSVQALASLTVSAGNGLYSVNLPTGKAMSRGNFNNQYQVIGIAIPLNQL